MAKKTPKSEYRAAMAAARRRAGAIENEVAREVIRSLTNYVDEITRLLASGADPKLEASRSVLQGLAEDLNRRLARSIEGGRTLSFEDTLAAWERAMKRVGEFEGIEGSTLGSIRFASPTMLNQYAALNGGQHWKTALVNHVADGARDVNRILFATSNEGLGAEELGRRLRRYVVGSEDLRHAFRGVRTKSGLLVEKIDLRRLKGADREAGRKLAGKSRRIGISETHNGRAEAEVQHFMADPFIAASRWTLSPNRGTRFTPPDECDVLARADFYGLGGGIYPTAKVPAPPHPYDRCEKEPVTRPGRQASEPKWDGVFRPSAGRSAAASLSGWSKLSRREKRSAIARAKEAARLTSPGIGDPAYLDGFAA